MGMYVHRIEFAQGLPSFDAISRQFKGQTGLDLLLFATVHLPDALPTPRQLTAALAQDAAAVADLEADYEAAQAPLVAAQQYEKAAAIRDRFKARKDQRTYISGFELAVRFDCYHLITVEVAEQYLEIEHDSHASYTISSLLKCLLELGGQLQGADERRMQTLYKEWRRLKWWQDYRWYNRPHR